MAAIMSTKTSMSATSSTTSPPSNVGSAHPFTCNTCQVAFRSSELQRGHMRSDWHRYNLKRRIASLPPLSSEVFAEKVLSAQASSSAAAAKASYETVCQACQKTYFSENAYQNHLGSQKHKAKVLALHNGSSAPSDAVDDETASVMSSTFSLGEPIGADESSKSSKNENEADMSNLIKGIKDSTIETTKNEIQQSQSVTENKSSQSSTTTPTSSTVAPSDAPKGSPLLTCMFCNYVSPSLALNVSHMGKIHGMFIPEQTYLTDLEGLVKYLAQKVLEYHECLYCGKTKGTIVGVQTHMRDKGHCMIAFSTEEQMIEVGQFYDFRSTYSDTEGDSGDEDEMDEDGSKENAGVKLGAKRRTNLTATAIDEDGNAKDIDEEEVDADGWETDSSASSLDSADLTAVPLDDHSHQYQKLHKHPHHSHHDTRPHHNKDGWHSHAHHSHAHAVYHSEYELHLPTGRTAGHRSLARYFRQNLHNYPSSNSQAEMRAIGNGSSTENEVHRGRQLVSRANGGLGMIGVTDAKKREIQAVEKRERKREGRARDRHQWGVDKRGNMQKHFRDPLLQ